MSVAVVVDSAAALPDEVVDRHAITVVPIHVMVGGRPFRDHEVSLDEVLGNLDDGLTTSGPTPGEFAQVFEAALADHDGVVAVTVSARMSSTHDAAVLGAQTVGGAIRVVDSTSAAGAEGLVAVAAARSAAAGADVGTVEATARDVAGRVRLRATVDRLDRLVASGRIPGAAGWAGRKMGVNPVFEFVSGEARPLRPAFSRSGALERIVEACAGSRPAGEARLHAAVLHVRATDAAEHLLAAVRSLDAGAETFVGSFSPAMVVHTGPGVAGLGWWWQQPPPPDRPTSRS